jgi:mRNA interferase YafQ
MLKLEISNAYKRDFKKCERRGKNMLSLAPIIANLRNRKSLPFKYKDHKLIGNYKGFRELHIEPDWLLIYKIEGENLLLHRMGSHNDLFD